MDLALIIGLLVAFGSVFAMITIEGGHVSGLLLPGPMVLVFGATLAIGFASGTVKDAIYALKQLPRAFRGKVPKPIQVIEEIVAMADKARREGLLALESDANDADDPFMKNALQNIADGTDGESLRVLLEDQMGTKIKTERAGAKWFKTLGGYAPTIGIIGTVVSLTHVLENLDSPDTLGPMIAAAFVATLWGLVSANFIWLPIGDRLLRLTDLESDRMNLILEGMLAVQEGAQPRLLGERLRAMVPAHALPKEK
jgi:chemotaxis protein MotA